MCGIFGQLLTGRGQLDPAVLERATQTLLHRGPDDGGAFHDGRVFLGHRRLSIIDLGAGQQPMASTDRRFVICFNGEIYNYVEVREELRAAGARFATGSDTEVIIEAVRVWGPKALERLIGMFAFALYDRQDGSLLLARDRLGEKPLLFVENARGVTFASELKALVAAGVATRDIDPEVLAQYLALNYVPGTQALLKGVERLAPGSWRRWQPGAKPEGGRYWSPPDPAAAPLTYASEAAALPELRRRLDDAVRVALRSDVPVTLFLSGGIDSSLIAESAVRQGMIGTAYCLDFAEESFSEWAQAKRVADKLGIELRRAEASVPDPALFERIVAHADDPMADSSAVAVWYLAERTARDFKVVITGDGGDELFGGYLTYQATALYRRFHDVLPAAALRALASPAAWLRPGQGKVTTAYKMQRFARAFGLDPAVAHMTWNGAFLPDAAERLMAPALRSAKSGGGGGLARLVRAHGVGAKPALRDLQRLDALEYLPNDILVKVDRIAMAHGLESRAPFLAPGVAEFGLALPDEMKLKAGGKPKHVLRALTEQTFGPEISNAKKQGFSIPVHRWLRGPMRASLEANLGTAALANLPFLDADAVASVRDAHLSGRRQFGFELWGLMVLSAWWRHVAAPAQSQTSVAPLKPLVLQEIAA